MYSLRAILISLFLLLPISSLTIGIFSCVMGLLWLSTVPLTSGLVSVMFGTRFLGSLYGFVFLSHQLGAFCGVLMGGVVHETTGSYREVWIVAALLHMPIREQFSAKMTKENISPLRNWIFLSL